MSTDDPYLQPQAPVAQPARPGALFSLRAIAWASLAATAPVGLMMIAANYAALGQRRRAWWLGAATVCLLVPATWLVVLAVAVLVGNDRAGAASLMVAAIVALLQPLAAGGLAFWTQRQAIRARVAAGGPMRSRAALVAVVLSSWALCVLCYAAMVVALGLAVHVVG